MIDKPTLDFIIFLAGMGAAFVLGFIFGAMFQGRGE